MTLVSQLLQQIADPSLPHGERARLRCRLAKELEDTGNYEAAREAMGELWSRVGERPELSGLDEAEAAEVLLRVGALTGWMGSIKQIEGSQELAKNLISEGLTTFEALRDTEKAAEAQMELGYCYWRQGAFDEARVLLKEALSRMADRADDCKAVTLLRLAIVEKVTLRLSDALRLLTEAAPLFEASRKHTIKGRFHNELAIVLGLLVEVERRSDYIDRALIEYAAASYHFEQAGHRRYQACVENNLGVLFCTVGRYSEAHEHLDRALALFTSMKDSVHIAQVDETRAKVLLAEGRIPEAEKLVLSAVQTLERGGEQSLLAEALTTYGITLARSGRHEAARLTLQRSVEVAQNAGDLEGAGQAALTIIEELGEKLTFTDLSATFERASELLSTSQYPANKDRLLSCSRRVLHLAWVLPLPPTWTDFNFFEAVRRYEARLIERALKDAGGIITRAAQLLGIRRQSLDAMLHEGRHQNLLSLRTPIEPRKRSLMFRDECCTETRPVTILYVEDDSTIAEAVKVTLEDEGWTVEMCADGTEALKILAGYDPYDVLIFDNQLPGVSGIELILQARTLAHRQETPIIMLSGSDIEKEARRAGADTFMSKPQDVPALAETIARLLARKIKKR